MKHQLILPAAALLLSLSACENKPEEVDTRAPDPMASELANAAPIELPPAIKANVTFRCQPGNAVVYVDFFQGDTQATVRTEKEGTPTILKAEKAGDPLTGGGYTLTGTPKSATVTKPGGATLKCSA